MTEDEEFRALCARLDELVAEAHMIDDKAQTDMMRMALDQGWDDSQVRMNLAQDAEHIGASIHTQLSRAERDFPERSAEIKQAVLEGLDVGV